jgi:nucleotide-binding universal stress UspA family protein
MPKKSTPRSAAGAASGGGKSPNFRLKRILVPLDFSGASRQALPAAIALAEKFDARIVLVHIVTPVMTPTMPPTLGVAFAPAPISGLRKVAAKQLHERGEKLVPRSLYERSIVSMGHAASEIIAIAGRTHADLIVLTTRGRSGVTRFLMGSTAEQVVRHAKCPVMTIQHTSPKRRTAPEARKQTSRRSAVPPLRAL